MRTFILVCVVAILVACSVAYAVGLVAITSEHSEQRTVVSLIVNTDMIRQSISSDELSPGDETPKERFQDVKGKITEIRMAKNEIVLSENFKNWTFQLAKDGKVFINDREGRLADLLVGDHASVSFDRQREVLIASVIRSYRK